jgi:hypothetical protein
MTPEIQIFAALAVVAVAATWLVLRALSKRKAPGCGGDCGCAHQELKR